MEQQNNWHLLKYMLFAENPNDKNEIFCANLLSGTCFSLTHEEFNLLFKFHQLNEDNEVLKKFIQQGIVINFNEQSLLKTMSKKLNYSFNSLKLTICPTIGCNFNCPYCFENHIPSKMSEEVQNDILKFLKNNKNLKRLNITWYGGEPLLFPEIIESLSNKIINFTKENNINYTANIITNGFLLTQEIADMLNRVKVSSYQITLDGMGEKHNVTRHLVNGGPTFDRIIQNLKNIKINGHISIRHNVYEENKDEVNELQNFVKKLREESGNNITYYAVPVAGNFVAEKRKENVKLLSKNKAAKIEAIKDAKRFSKGDMCYCGTQTLGFIVIDTEGRLYKCWEDVDKPERSFGNIKTWNPFNPLYSCKNLDILSNYLNTMDVLDDLECRECILLPFCRGGCPNKRLYYKKRCPSYKDNPEILVLELAKRYLNKNKNFLDK